MGVFPKAPQEIKMVALKMNKRLFFAVSFLFLAVFLSCSLVLARETVREKLRERRLEKKGEVSDNYQPGDYNFSLAYDGIVREYSVHIPRGYKNTVPTPIVIYLHGGGGSIKAAYKDGIDKYSDKFGFILLIPSGTGPIPDRFLTWNGGKWDGGECCGYAVKNNIDDVGFISRMIGEVKKKFNIDENRVYATGISNGGILSYRLACELSDKIAAVAVVAPPAVPSNCIPARPVSIMHIHGTADPCVSFNGGLSGGCIGSERFQAQSAKNMVDFWLKNNGCPSDFTVSYEKGKAKCISYGPCKNGTFVEFCTIEGGGHAWPSGSQYLPVDRIGPVSYDISFDQIWEFFQKYPRK
jgi:polyhydroxybutyrate depolymerase